MTQGQVEVTSTTPEAMQAILERQREAFLQRGAPTRAERELQLTKLQQQVLKYQDDIIAAISADFGNRSRHETLLAEIFMVVAGLKHARKRVGKWMRPRRRPIAMEFLPGRGKVHYQPKGVVGIIAPWNYPFQLALGPLAGILAAGNRAMLKPSEFTPRTGALLDRMLSEVFSPEEVAVVQGGPEIGQAFSTLQFDHLLYTGSTRVGRLVMKAAAENLVPVTLELGGKSPVIVSRNYPMEKAVASIASGKLLNAGQTCVAPDYTFVPEGTEDRFVDLFMAKAEEMYPTLRDNPDYTSIVADNHYERINGLVEDARGKDARLFVCNPKDEDLGPVRKIAPTLLLDTTENMAIRQEEIFGPVMPVVTYKDEAEVRDYINRHPRPLAMYYFGNDSTAVENAIENTTFGGGCVNETLFHFGQEELPFGGVGPSGLGAYHGEYGFETFSHAKGVFYQSSLNAAGLLRAPYGRVADRMLGFLIGK